MSLTITIGRTEGGLFRAEITEGSRLIIEHTDLLMLVEALREKLATIAVTPDGQLLFFEAKTEVDDAACAEAEKRGGSDAELDERTDRFPDLAEPGDEPAWPDTL
jgi:hypothetical protein